jgi:3-deoxy-D-manno-octulosonic-acid transferase
LKSNEEIRLAGTMPEPIGAHRDRQGGRRKKTARGWFWFSFYNLIIIPLLFAAMEIARLFLPKVRDGIRERRGLFSSLHTAASKLEPGRRFVVIHCTSAGEFEAARPVIASIKERLPAVKVHVTCYSPSGMKLLKKAEEVESYSYLPFDDLRSARRFFQILNPAAFLIVKHDVWPNMVWAASSRNIPIFWINANLHSRTRRLKPLSRCLNRSFLREIDEILTVGDDHALRFARLVSPAQVHVIGDSRYDRTLERARMPVDGAEIKVLGEKLGALRVIVAGSTWGADQRILIPVFAKLKNEYHDLRLILVPHEPKEEFLADTQDYLEGYGLSYSFYTKLNGEQKASDVYVVDKVGVLASLYRLAWAAYIGGAFGKGVHSVLEPAVYRLPLFFGPNYYMSHEAAGLVQRGGAWTVASAPELEERLRSLLDEARNWETAAQASGDFVRNGAGATERIVAHLERYLSGGT